MPAYKPTEEEIKHLNAIAQRGGPEIFPVLGWPEISLGKLGKRGNTVIQEFRMSAEEAFAFGSVLVGCAKFYLD